MFHHGASLVVLNAPKLDKIPNWFDIWNGCYGPMGFHTICSVNLWEISRNQSLYVFSRWEMMLQCDAIYHWLVAYTEWSLHTLPYKSSKVEHQSCQHWFRLWLGAVRQQAITWTNVDFRLEKWLYIWLILPDFQTASWLTSLTAFSEKLQELNADKRS